MNDDGETVKYLPLQQLENKPPPPAVQKPKKGAENNAKQSNPI